MFSTWYGIQHDPKWQVSRFLSPFGNFARETNADHGAKNVPVQIPFSHKTAASDRSYKYHSQWTALLSAGSIFLMVTGCIFFFFFIAAQHGSCTVAAPPKCEYVTSLMSEININGNLSCLHYELLKFPFMLKCELTVAVCVTIRYQGSSCSVHSAPQSLRQQ